nr:EOG090X0BCY [Eurycercus lamellatus]
MQSDIAFLNEGEGSDAGIAPSEETDDEELMEIYTPSTGTKPKKKSKKKKKQQQNLNNEVDLDDDFLLQELPDKEYAAAPNSKPSLSKSVLSLEQKSLNADNELKKIFGTRVVTAGQKKKVRGRAYVKTTWLINPKDNWSQIRKTGLSMSLDHTKNGCFYFKFEHNKEYRQIQFTFWEAVASLNPANIVALVNMHPYHIDSLIQLSDVCRMSDDTQMATELIERSLYILESAFHPSFNLASGNCRLEYKQQENRALFLAIFKHLVYIGLKGCYRTALEFCKLLYTLDLDTDPLAVILMMDFYAIKANEFSWFIEFFDAFEPKKNLSQLPNMAFAIALAHFYHAKSGTTASLARSDEYLQQALLMFPGVLIPLLDKCSIQADGRVTKHPYFSLTLSNPPSLNNLIQLYVGRSFHIWKDADLLPWLERNANSVLNEIDRNPSATAEYEEKRKKRYQGTPRNIYRHILLSDIKDATATLPQELADAPVMSFDPLPPVDSVTSYSRPNRTANNATAASQMEGGLLSSFFRSLMPGFNPQEVVNNHPVERVAAGQQIEPAEDDAAAAEGASANLQRSVATLVTAMRDLLSSIQLPDLGHPQESDEEDDHSD